MPIVPPLSRQTGLSSRRGRLLAPLLILVLLSACDLFGEKKQPLPGERISVLSLDRQLEPDPALAAVPIALQGEFDLPVG